VTVLLAHASGDPRTVLARAGAGPGAALLLIEDHRSRERWAQALGPGWTPVGTGEAMREAEAALRRPFLDRWAELGRRHASPAWWASPVGERNTLTSPLFLHCCWLRVARRALPAGERRALLVVCESQAVLDAAGPGSSLTRRRRRAPRRAVRSIAGFARTALRRRRQSPGAPPSPGAGPRTLIRTWVDEASVRPFRDRYFGGLAAWLEGQGHEVTTWPVLFAVDAPDAAWEALRAGSGRFLRAEALLTLGDHLWALGQAARTALLPRGRVEVAGLDVTGLVAEERRRAAFDPAALDALALYRLPRRLHAAGWRFDRMIEPFEHMAGEKLLRAGFRRDAPATRLVGYQHSTLPPLMLCLYIPAGEAAIAPLPDVVVTSGRLWRDVLAAEGLPEELLRIGPALRATGRPPGGGDPHGGVLVPLPLPPGAAAELLAKATAALAALERPLLVKPHPMAGAAAPAIPSDAVTVDDDLGAALSGAALVLGLASSATVQAVTDGVPTVVVGREAALDIDPLGWTPDAPRPVSAPPDIAARARELLALGAEEREAWRLAGERLSRACFGAVDDEHLRAFLA
jgi:hypothetical protein